VIATASPDAESIPGRLRSQVSWRKGRQLNHFLKNLAIISALLYVAVFGGGALSVDGRKGGAQSLNASIPIQSFTSSPTPGIMNFIP
jgi:hypothetical protein